MEVVPGGGGQGGPGLVLGGGRGSQCWLSTQTGGALGLGGLLCTGGAAPLGGHGLDPPLLPPPPAQPGFGGGSGLHPHWGGCAGSAPPTPSPSRTRGGALGELGGGGGRGGTAQGTPPDAPNCGGGGIGTTCHGGEGGAQCHGGLPPKKKNPKKSLPTWGGGNTSKMPLQPPPVPDPPLSTDPALGRVGGCGWECVGGGPQCRGGP